jgi:hypothetical protein
MKQPYAIEDYCAIIKLIMICSTILYIIFLVRDCSREIIENSHQVTPYVNSTEQETAFLPKDDVLVWRGHEDGIPLDILDESIRVTLDRVDLPYNEKVIKLLIGTVAAESYCGRVCESEVNDADFGIFQINIYNEQDIWENYLKYNPALKKKVEDVFIDSWSREDNLKYNLSYQIICAYLTYQRKGAIFPVNDDVWTLSYYWKSAYNTSLGEGSTQHFYDAYNYYVKGEK